MAIANTLAKYIIIKVKRAWSKYLQDDKENRMLILCIKNALLLTDFVNLLKHLGLKKLQDLRSDFEETIIRNGGTSRIVTFP